MVLFQNQLLFAASGFDLSWSLRAERQCNWQRQSSTVADILYVVAASTVWDPLARPDCPRGWRWATTVEGESRFGSFVSGSDEEPYVFWNQCDWKGYSFASATRRRFRFADSYTTGAFKHAGRRDSAAVEFSFDTADHAGLVCVSDPLSLPENSPTGRELWILSDVRRPQTARRLVDMRQGPRGSSPRFLTVFASFPAQTVVVFQATQDDVGAELFLTDGSTAGTTLVEDIWRGPRSSSPGPFVEWLNANSMGAMYFAATTDFGRELWATTGATFGGTTLVRDICVGTASSEPQFLTPMGTMGVFFSATDCVNGRELWVTDGSQSGTRMVVDLNVAPGVGSDPLSLVAFRGKLFFSALRDSSTGRELFFSDGTAQGTRMLVDLAPGAASSAPSALTVVTAAQSAVQDLYFLATTGDRNVTNLWKTDGTSANTLQVWDEIFALSHTPAMGSRSSRRSLFTFANSLYIPMKVSGAKWANAAVQALDLFQLNITVDVGQIVAPGASPVQGPASSLSFVGTSSFLTELLKLVTFVPPLNWNAAGKDFEAVAARWQFVLSHGAGVTDDVYTERAVEATFASLVVRPSVDPPVIEVANCMSSPTQSTGDFLSALCLNCPIVQCVEDVECPLQGVSVRAVDATSELARLDVTFAVSRGLVLLDVETMGCVLRHFPSLAPRSVKSIRWGSRRIVGARNWRFEATLSCVNALLSRPWHYRSDSDVSGADALTMRVSFASTDGSAAQDSVVVPLQIREANDAPFLIVRDYVFVAREDEALVLSGLELRDPDLGAQERVTVEIRVDLGTITPLYQGQDIVTISDDAKRSLRLTGGKTALNAALTSLAYTSALDWNSLASDQEYDHITFRLTDEQASNSSTRTTCFVFVEPTPDAVVIAPPQLLHSTVFQQVAPLTLAGLEDEWIETRDCGFTSVDDTTRTTLDVELRTQHGRLEAGSAVSPWLLEGVTVQYEQTPNGWRRWRLRGRFAAVNRSVSALRYLPDSNWFGTDALEISASAVDQVSQQQSLPTTQWVTILVSAVNDAPVWSLPHEGVWAMNASRATTITGVSLSDVDAASDSAIEVVLETSRGRLSLPELQDSITSLTFSAPSSYLLLTGTLEELNAALSEIVWEMELPNDAETPLTLTQQPLEIWLTADDQGASGLGGPIVSRATIRLEPSPTLMRWVPPRLSIHVPSSPLATPEDVPLSLESDLEVQDTDDARARASLYELTIASLHGDVHMQSSVGLQLERTTVPLSHAAEIAFEGADSGQPTRPRLLRLRGFLQQLNDALVTASYAPDPDWFGTEELIINATVDQLAPKSETVSVTLFIVVTPVCDEPTWRLSPHDLAMNEDEDVVVSSLSLVDPDLSDARRVVAVSIDVLPWTESSARVGGVMLAMTRGLELLEPTFMSPTALSQLTAIAHASQESATSQSRLFFSHVRLVGRVDDLNAALQGLIFRPPSDLHTNGHIVDAIRFAASALPACGNTSKSARSEAEFVLRTRVTPRIDALELLPTSLVTRWSDITEGPQVASPTMEATEAQPQPLPPLRILDIDADAMDGPPTLITVRLSCLHCSVRPSAPLDTLQRLNQVLVTLSGSDAAALTLQGTLISINDAVLGALVFRGTDGFAGDAWVLIDVVRGDSEVSKFAIGVRVTPVNRGVRILLPPTDIPLVVGAEESLLLRGAPPLDPVDGSSSTVAASAVTKLVRCTTVERDSVGRRRSLFESPRPTTGSGDNPGLAIVPGTGVIVFAGYTQEEGDELWATDGDSTWKLRDLSPGPSGSSPAFFSASSADSNVYFSASGVDESWRVPTDHRDHCGSARASAFAPDVVFVVSASATWLPSRTYDCPAGLRWMTTAEAERVFIGTFAKDGYETEPPVYYDQCGWSGFQWGGVARTAFRFADSHVTGAFKHAGHRDSFRPDVGFQTDDFAGIVCRKSDRDHVRRELWKTDGTPQGTVRVSALSSPSAQFDPQYLVEFQGRLYFQATTDPYGAELWQSDGSEMGTELVADVAFGVSSSYPAFLTVANSILFFAAETPAFGRELWLSDGAMRTDYEQIGRDTAGTRMVLDIRSGPQSSSPRFLVALPSAGLLLFQADDGVRGAELWVSDGSAANTKIVADICSGPQGSSPSFLTHFGGRVFFQANDCISGAELWVSDGSSLNTRRLVDIAPGALSSSPRHLSVLSLTLSPSASPVTTLLFAAQSDADRATEWWQTDGSVAGTSRLFAGSREVLALLPDDARQRAPVVSIRSDSLMYFEQDASVVRRSQDLSAPRSRSVSLVDDRPGGLYTLTLSVMQGSLSLSSRGCPDFSDQVSRSPQSQLRLRGTMPELNCWLTEVVYNANGADRPERQDSTWVTVEITVTEELQDSSANDGRTFTTTAQIPVRVMFPNRAPVIVGPDLVSLRPSTWLQLPQLRVNDDDVRDDDDGDDALLHVWLTVRLGALRVPILEQLTATRQVVLFSDLSDDGAQTIDFAAPLQRINALLQSLEYACFECSDADSGDELTIVVDDNGFSGTGGAQSATAVMRILHV
ncbi:hypothetical protein PINS_up013291 [Pythium insidiosum]|nr:hypothetical protein PINS_up013291 [Pythium insidiosum]